MERYQILWKAFFLPVFLLLLIPLRSGAVVFLVQNTNDVGAGSFRQAIADANSNAGKDTIHFQISGNGPHSIQISSGLLLITEDIVIDATTQAGYDPLAPMPMIEIYNSPNAGIQINSGAGATGSVLKGLIINRCSQIGLQLFSSNNIIQGCFIGVDVTGTLDQGNAQSGIYIHPTSQANIIGGRETGEKNVISGNDQHGIIAETSSGNYFLGNYIGTDITGMLDLGNGINGINFSNGCTNNKIGGASPDSLNIISGNSLNGISIIDGSHSNFVRGNLIGIGSDGLISIGNGEHGIYIGNSNNIVIGGVSGNFKNVIASNAIIGINIQGSAGTVIKSNFIGTTADGLLARGNGVHGIQLQNARETIIGGSRPSEGNIISATTGAHGINLDPGCNKSVIKGNLIGTDITGTSDLGNNVIGVVLKSDSCIVGGRTNSEGNIISASKILCGLLIANGSDNIVQGNLIGTTMDTTALGNKTDGINISVEDNGAKAIRNIVQYNVVAYNGNHGISVGDALNDFINNNEYSNDLRFNSTFCNKEQGIYINSSNPSDYGNNGKTAPVINVLQSTASTIVGVPNGLLISDTIDIYEMVDCPNCDYNPQGKIYVASVQPDVSGNWSYDHGSSLTGTLVAMVTDQNGNSSQFGLCYTPCGVTAIGTISSTLIDLNNKSEEAVLFTSSSTGNSLSPLPLQLFWSVGSPDTTGTNLLSTAATFSVSFQRNPSGSALGPDTYDFYLVAKQGACLDTMTFNLTVLFIPNLVTPNSDHLNDRWKVSNRDDLFEAKIYNRWGDLVFHKRGYKDEWNVYEVMEGIYYYHLNDLTGNGRSYKGWVQVLK